MLDDLDACGHNHCHEQVEIPPGASMTVTWSQWVLPAPPTFYSVIYEPCFTPHLILVGPSVADTSRTVSQFEEECQPIVMGWSSNEDGESSHLLDQVASLTAVPVG